MAIQIIPPQAEALEGLASVMVSRTANPSFPAAYADLTFDVTDIEVDPLIIEHNNTNTDRIDIKADGVYAINYNMSMLVTADLVVHSARVRKNDTTVLDQSEQQAKPLDTQEVALANTIVVELLAGDFVSLQLQGDTGTTAVKVNFVVTALSGIKGDEGVGGPTGSAGATGAQGIQGIQGDPGPQGPTGSGTNLTAQDEGVDVANTPHSKYNFVGTGVTATDQGAGVLKVDIPGDVDHTAVTLDAGDGLSGGGDISVSRTFDVDINPEVSVPAAPTDEVLIADASDSFNIKKVTVQSIADLGGGGGASVFAQLSSSVDQEPTATTPTVITYNTQDDIAGLTHSTTVNPGEITIVTAGTYFILAQPQVGKDSGGAAQTLNMFMQIDRGSGFVDEPNTNIKVSVSDNTATDVIVLGIAVVLAVGDKLRKMQRITNTTVGLGLKFTAAEVGPPTVPATPSIILTMFRIGA